MQAKGLKVVICSVTETQEDFLPKEESEWRRGSVGEPGVGILASSDHRTLQTPHSLISSHPHQRHPVWALMVSLQKYCHSLLVSSFIQIHQQTHT